jgi:hypothetical protein
MCEPMMMGIIGAVASAASSFASMSAQQDAMNKQNEANAQWVAYQRREREQAMARDEEMRVKSESARQDTLNQLTPDAQKAAQDTEQQRLTKDLTPTNLQGEQPVVGDELLAGTKGADPLVTQDLTKRVNNAAVQARTRIANLATVQSYGGSQFGLQNRAQDLFNKSGENIRLWSDERQGNLAALSVATNVEPEKFQASPSPFGGIAGSLASLAGKGLTTPNIGGGGSGFFGS